MPNFSLKSDNNYSALFAKYILKRKMCQMKFVYKNTPYILPPIHPIQTPIFLKFHLKYSTLTAVLVAIYTIKFQSSIILNQC